jgi:tellurite methyltransferase
MLSDQHRWNQRYAEQKESPVADSFLIEAVERWIAPHFPQGGHALDLAGGRGQNSIYLVKRAWQVTLVDISDIAILDARTTATTAGLSIDCEVADAGSFLAPPNHKVFNLVIVFFFLDRKLWPGIRRVMGSGSMLVYKTYTTENLRYGCGPTNPNYLLQSGELREEFSDFEVVHSRETKSAPAVAELVAVRR